MSASAQVPGPRVYRDYDQAGLDAAYNQAAYCTNLEQINLRCMSNSIVSRGRLGEPTRVSYGASEAEYLEIYRTSVAQAPIFAFVRGGAWRKQSIDRYAFLAESLVAAGAHCVLVQYDGVDETGGDLVPLANQVRAAILWLFANAGKIDADPTRIFVGGHSSGAHLVGVAVTTDWRTFGAPTDIIRGALCCSGMFDMIPVRLSSRSSYVKFDDAAVTALSAMQHIEAIQTPLIVAYGTWETPEFQRQSRDFTAALEAAGRPVQLIVGEGYNHFELIETLGNPYSILGHALFEQMMLSPGVAVRQPRPDEASR